MKVGSGLLTQLEKCGLSAQLADLHAEVSADASSSRKTRIEIARAYHANDKTDLPEANAALAWLVAQPGPLVSVCEPLDLIDDETGEVLVSGKPGAVLEMPDVVLVVAWKTGDQFDAPEPEDDLGLVAMGLAAARGQAFQVAHVALRHGEAFPRRSPVFEPAGHPALWARIKAAVSRPRIACPGDWCGSCRQHVYCTAWLARARTALAVIEEEAPVTENDEGELQIPKLDLTTETASAGMVRVKLVKKACELFEEQVKSFVRHGGRVIVNGKEYYAGQRAGKESVDVAALKAAGLKQYIKKGDPYEQFGWRKPR